jgi:hypothetical protein
MHSKPATSFLKQTLVVFAGVALIYGAVFYLIEYRRNFRGGWQVEFAADASGVPSITITQPTLSISNVSVVFHGETAGWSNAVRSMVFNQPNTNLPFGGVIFIDTTFLPGSIVFEFFGHEVDLFPNQLMLNRKAAGWPSGATFDLRPEDKLSPEEKQLKRR